MKIVILNKCFFENDHLERLRKYGSLITYKNTTTENEIIRRLNGVEIAVANGLIAPFTERVFRNTKSLRLLVLNSTGFDFTDVKAARKNGISIANTPMFAADAVAEHVIALILSIMKKLPICDRAVKKLPFEINPGLDKHQIFQGEKIKGKTLGILGLGATGSKTAELGLNLGMKVIAYTHQPRKRIKAIKLVGFAELLKLSDVISIHLPLIQDTKYIIGKKEFALMKPSAIIINTARGRLINNAELYRFLKSNRIAGAGLDVLENLSQENPLLKLNNVIITPHSAWWTKNSLVLQADTIVQTIEAFCRKRPINIIN